MRLKREHGRILSVETKQRGAALDADVAAGATSITVDDAGDFDEDGGWLYIGSQTVEYAAADDDTGVLTLADPLTEAAEQGDPVAVWSTLYDEVVDYQEALVELDGEFDNPDPVVAEVAEGVNDLPEGDRGEAGESCTLRRVADDEWEVVDVGGRPRKSRGVQFFQDSAKPGVPGDFAITLTHEPIPNSEHVYWNGLYQPASQWGRSGRVLTVSDSQELLQSGDQIDVEYAYLAGEASPALLNIPLGYIWRYKTGLSSSTTYAQPDFDDSGWDTGPSPFGYNYPGIATVIGTTVPVWTRIKVTTQGGGLTFAATTVDDTASVYLDGSLIWSPTYSAGHGPYAATFPCAAGGHTIAIYGTDIGTKAYFGFTITEGLPA